MEKKVYRHEFKYICSEAQLACLKGRLSGVMRYDAHADFEGKLDAKLVEWFAEALAEERPEDKKRSALHKEL